MPEMLDSRFAFISAVVSFTFFDVLDKFCLEKTTINIITGMEIITITASSQRIFNNSANEPSMVKTAMEKSSGPWCASSVISKRSVVARAIIFPVLFESK